MLDTHYHTVIIEHESDSGDFAHICTDVVVATHPMDVGFPAPSGTLSRPEYIAAMEAVSESRRMADAMCWDGVNAPVFP